MSLVQPWSVTASGCVRHDAHCIDADAIVAGVEARLDMLRRFLPY
jgi:hypothetical protein